MNIEYEPSRDTMPPHQKRKRGNDNAGFNDRQAEAKKLAAACTACRKQKIKCDLIDDEPPCTRCQRRGLHCVLHTANRNQTSEDHKQIGLLNKDVSNIHATLKQICSLLNLEDPTPLLAGRDLPDINGHIATENDETDLDGNYDLSPAASPSAVQAPIDTYLTGGQPETSPHDGSPRRTRRRPSERLDLIGKGSISIETANVLVHRYLTCLDRFLYAIAGHYNSLDEIRQASPVLLAAICSVSALHDPQSKGTFEICVREFRGLVSASLFEKRDIEYIRALCIGSFWLPGASRVFLGDAIRRAADCRLHRDFYRLSESSTPGEGSTGGSLIDVQTTRDRVRLWYLLYIGDSHLSILHNRDPVMRPEKDGIDDRVSFVAVEHTIDDIRIISQVSLLVIMGQVKDTFGSEQSKPMPRALAVQLTHFAKELDRWFAEYSPSFEPDPHIGPFPLAGLTCHHQFSKLYLGHHVFRGLQADPIPPYFLSAATMAREAAITIFTIIVENEDFRNHVVGMPAYFHIMISFAGQFLLEVCMKYRDQLNANVEEDFRRVSKALVVFTQLDVMPQHALSRVTAGLMRKLNECMASLGMEGLLAESPFANLAWPCNSGEGYGNPNLTMPTNFDFPMTNGIPDELLYTDFSDMAFLDPNFGFIT